MVILTILGIRKDPSLWPLAIALLGVKIKFHVMVLNLIGLSTVFFLTFDVNNLLKIRQLCSKERLQITSVAKF